MSDTAPVDPPEPDAPQPETQPEPPAARPDPWWSVAIMVLVLAGVVGGIVAAWLPIGPLPVSPAERYLPLANGLTLSYRVTHPDGAVSYQSENIGRQHGTSALDLLDISTRMRVISRITGTPPDSIEPEQYSEFLSSGARAVTVARMVDTNYDATGAITTTSYLLLAQHEQIEMLTVNGQPFEPPLPIFDSALAPGQQRVITGTVGGGLAYTATLALDGADAIETPIGRLDDCRRVSFALEIGASAQSSRAWYCAGIGLARQEITGAGEAGVTRYELIGLSAPARTISAERPAPLRPEAGGDLPDLSAAQLPGEIERLWSFHEQGFNTHITSAPLATGDMLIYGTQNGGLLALDRRTHTLRWRFQSGGAIYGAPAAAGGLVYFGSTDRRLYALDLQSGAFQWAFVTRDAISTTPAIAGGLVFFGSEDRTIYALDAATGAERWRYEAGDAVAGSPLVAGGVVYAGSDDGALYALDAATGAPLWAFAAEDAITAAPALLGDTLFVGSHDGRLYALRAAPEAGDRDGELLWSYDAGAEIASDIRASGGVVYLANADRELHAVDAATGQRHWRHVSSLALHGAPLLVGDRLLVNRRDDILALDAASGAERMVIPIGDVGSYHSLSGDGEELFVGHRGGFFEVLGAAGTQPWAGAPRWQADALMIDLFNAEDTFTTPPARYGDRLIYLTARGGVYSVTAADGSYERLGQVTDLGVVLLQPVIAGDILVMGDRFGNLAAFDLRERAERWRVAVPGRTFSKPALDEGRVLITATSDTTASAFAFDLESGAEVWRQDFDLDVGVGGSGALQAGRYFLAADRVVALDPASGDVLWRSPEPLIPLQIAAIDGAIYAVALDADTGSPLLAGWDAATGAGRLAAPLAIGAPPILQGGIGGGAGTLLLALTDRTLLALDAGTGAERWRVSEPSDIYGAPLVHGDAALVIGSDNRLLAHALADGRLVGDFAIESASGTSLYSSMAPLVDGGQLYAAFYQTAFALNLR